MILFVGTIGILIPGVQPVVLAALLAEQHITLTQLGHAASVELLSMGLAAALAAAFLPPRRLPAIACVTSLVLAAGNWLTPFAMGEMVTAVRALTGFTGGILIWVAACMIARSAAPDRWAGIYLTVQTLTQLLFAAAMSVWAEPKWGAQGDFALLAVAVLTAGFVIWRDNRTGAVASTAARSPIRSIAVLPLANHSGDSTQDYFAEGMTDELTTAIALTIRG